MGFGEIKRINDSTSKFVVYYFELKYILVPLFLIYNLYFLSPLGQQQFNLLLYVIEHNLKKVGVLPDTIPNYSPLDLNNLETFFSSFLFSQLVSRVFPFIMPILNTFIC